VLPGAKGGHIRLLPSGPPRAPLGIPSRGVPKGTFLLCTDGDISTLR
jgi:hypothetical protein